MATWPHSTLPMAPPPWHPSWRSPLHPALHPPWHPHGIPNSIPHYTWPLHQVLVSIMGLQALKRAPGPVRYDLDKSGTINTEEEMQQLCTNLCFKLKLLLPPHIRRMPHMPHMPHMRHVLRTPSSHAACAAHTMHAALVSHPSGCLTLLPYVCLPMGVPSPP